MPPSQVGTREKYEFTSENRIGYLLALSAYLISDPKVSRS